MTFVKRLAFLPTLAFWLLAMAGTALAEGPVSGAIGFQPPATPVAEKILDFHNLLLWIISAITVSPEHRHLGLYFDIHDHNIDTDTFESFVRWLRRSVRRQ